MKQKFDHYAIVIGIDRYKYFPSLQNAERDALSVANWLKSPDGGRLPAENVRLFLSNLSAPLEASVFVPEKWSIERALSEFGVQGGVRVGRRLTLYFGGYSCMFGPDDVGLLMADASHDSFDNSISLNSYRQFFQEFAPFDEVVFILDTHRLVIPAPGIQFHGPPFTMSRKRESATNVAVFSIGYHPRAGEAAEGRGRLTRAILEGLDGKAASDDGRITATSLGRYAMKRIKGLAAKENIKKPTQVNIAQIGEMVFGEVGDEQVTGTLLIELPHWNAQISIRDSQYRKIPDIGPFKEVDPGSGSYQAEVTLPKGIYEVQASLEGEIESQFVLIHVGKTAALKRDSWKTLALKSAAPLTGVTTSYKAQMKHAEKKSLKSTWTDHPRGDSRLFLFLRTEHPDKYLAFDEGLALLDEDGVSVTDFSHGVKRNPNEGWMAFNAKLPSGFYILRRGRKGVRLRHQAIYLCADWETHVFLLARDNFPSLSTMAMDMSPLGAGFQADDVSTAAAESVIWSLGQTAGEVGIVGSERLKALLARKKINPWLGILASYVLLRAGLEEGSESASLLRRVLAYLKEAVPDHPDVHALHLKEDRPADRPFWNPPLLRAGLERVHAHAIRFADTIPLDSLCDVVLDNFIPNMPWTAWRHLNRQPVSQKGAVTKGLQPGKTKAEGLHIPFITQSLTQRASPDLPVYALSQLSSAKVQQDEFSRALTDIAPAEAALLQQVQALTATTNFDNRPETMQVNLGGVAESLLANVNPEDVSEASGIPLARAQRGLQGLHLRKDLATTAEPGSVAVQKALSADEQVVINYAVQQQASLSEKKADYPSVKPTEEKERFFVEADPGTSPPAESNVTMAEPKITIEEIAVSLQTEAERLLITGKPAAESKIASALAERLRKQADALLERAHYVVLTDPAGRILYSNGAFLQLISPARTPREERKKAGKSSTARATKQQKKNQRLWEKAIQAIQPGDSTMDDPLKGADGPIWVFKRTVIEDETGIKRADLYTFHKKGATELGWDVLKKIAALLPDLTFFAPMFAYSTGDDAGGYLKTVEGIVSRLETIVHQA